jgi:hypothetical protein
MPVKKQNPELLALKKQIKSDAVTIAFRVNRLAINVDKQPEGYLMQMIKWCLDDLDSIKEDVKRYYKLREF